MRQYWLIIFTFLMTTFSLPSHAQFEDLGGILEDIISGSQIPGQTPIHGQTAVETIPVTIHYDVPVPLDDHMITLSAYTPSDPSGTSKETQLLGQTRLMLNGLSTPLNLSLTVPNAMTKDLPFIRITAEVRDENNNRVMQNEREGLYRGAETPELTLLATGATIDVNEPPQISGLELIKAEVSIRDKKHIPKDGTLIIQLLENALAGSPSITIAAEKVIQIDQIAHPYAFTLERGLTADSQQVPLSLKAWITDWAGRKTHILRTPVPYNGADTDYKLILDSLAQGKNTAAGKYLNPALMAQASVHGEAVFDLSNGIPTGARLKVTLRKPVGAFGENPVLTSQTIMVRSQDKRIPFSLSTASTNFDPFIPAPILTLEIVDSRGNIFYDSGEISAKEGPQIVRLYARRGF